MSSESLSRFRRNKVAVASAVVLAGFCAMAAFAPLLSPYGPLDQDLANNYQSPSFEHPLGTDDLGRDTWSRLVHGSRVSLGIAVSSVLMGVFVGALIISSGNPLASWSNSDLATRHPLAS